MSSGTFQLKEPELAMPAAGLSQSKSHMISQGWKRTSNGNTLVQGVAGTTPEVDSDGTLSSRLPGEVDRLASLRVEALRRNIERVGAV